MPLREIREFMYDLYGGEENGDLEENEDVNDKLTSILRDFFNYYLTFASLYEMRSYYKRVHHVSCHT